MVNYAKQVVVLVGHEHRVYLVSAHDLLHIGYLRVGTHRLGACGHDVGNGLVEELCLPFLHCPADVAVGDESCYLSVTLGYTESQLAPANLYDGFAQVHLGSDHRHFLRAHHVARGGQQSLAEFASGVELREVLGPEVALLHQCHCHGVAHGKCCSRTARGGEVKRTCLLAHAHVDMIRAVFCQQRRRVAAHADDGYLHVQHHRNESQQFVGLSRVGYGEHHVVLGHHAQVSVEYVKGIDKERRSARTRQGCGNLRTNMSAFSHTGDNHLSVAAEHQFDSIVKIVVYQRYESHKGFRLVLDTLYCVITNVHLSIFQSFNFSIFQFFNKLSELIEWQHVRCIAESLVGIRMHLEEPSVGSKGLCSQCHCRHTLSVAARLTS